MSRKQLAALALAAATTLTGVGCGSSKSETTGTTAANTTTASTSASSTTGTAQSGSVLPLIPVPIASGTPLTHTQWLTKGDQICAQLKRELSTLKIKRAGELPRVLPQAAAYERAAVVQLAKLVPPASKASDWQQFLSSTLQLAEGSAKLAESVKLGDAITNSPIATATIAIERNIKGIAAHDGFKACPRI